MVAADGDFDRDIPPDADLVRPEDACPICGECLEDRLIWIDDDRVRCANCNAVYEPASSKRPE